MLGNIEAKKLIRLLKENKGINDIVKAFDAGRRQVFKCIAMVALEYPELRPYCLKFSRDDRRAKVKELFERGLKPYQIAKELHVAYYVVMNDLRAERKPEAIAKSKAVSKRRYLVKQKKLEGKSILEIANELGVHLSMVNSDLDWLAYHDPVIYKENFRRREKDAALRRKELFELAVESKEIPAFYILDKYQTNMNVIYHDIRILKRKHPELVGQFALSYKVEHPLKGDMIDIIRILAERGYSWKVTWSYIFNNYPEHRFKSAEARRKYRYFLKSK